MQVANTTKMFELVRIAVENGALDVAQGTQEYSSRQNFYPAVEKLEDRDYLEKTDAPLSSRFKYIWLPTEKARTEVQKEKER